MAIAVMERQRAREAGGRWFAVVAIGAYGRRLGDRGRRGVVAIESGFAVGQVSWRVARRCRDRGFPGLGRFGGDCDVPGAGGHGRGDSG